jgi:hypothetical protein
MTAIQANAPQQSLAAAQSRFKQAVSQGIVQLMQQCGYSRERATAALLRELGRGDVSPDTNEVRHAPTSCFVLEARINRLFAREKSLKL